MPTGDHGADNQLEPNLADMVAAGELARRIYHQRRDELLDANALDGLEALDANYAWVEFV